MVLVLMFWVLRVCTFISYLTPTRAWAQPGPPLPLHLPPPSSTPCLLLRTRLPSPSQASSVLSAHASPVLSWPQLWADSSPRWVILELKPL